MALTYNEQVEELIAQAKQKWKETHGNVKDMMLPLIRLKVSVLRAGLRHWRVGMA
jgi:hypothetical protein